MAALKSLRPAISALLRNPILVVVVGLFGLIQLPQFALQSTQPLMAGMISLGMSALMVLVMPFFMGGLIGMADEALGGRTGLGTLVSDGKSNYITLLLAYLAILAVNFVIGIGAFFVAIVGGVGVFVGDGQPGFAALGVLVIVGILFVLVYLLVAFVIQFYPQAIVLSDTGLVAGFKRSIGLVRRNLVSVIGYTLIVLVGSLIFGGVGGVASILLAPQPQGVPIPELSLPILAGVGIVYVVALAVLGGFYATYSVAFYRSIEDSFPAARS